MAKILLGDCIDVMQDLEARSVDAVITDPPYGIGFMGKGWDRIGNAWSGEPPGRRFQEWVRQWAAECNRVLKPGGHCLAFGAPRMFGRLHCGLEDAGFEIRDALAWLYAMGYPKSHNVAATIYEYQNQAPATETPAKAPTPEMLAQEAEFRAWLCDKSGIDQEAVVRELGRDYDRFWTGRELVINTVARWKPPVWARCSNLPTAHTWAKIKKHLPEGVEVPVDIEELLSNRLKGSADDRPFLERLRDDRHRAPESEKVAAEWVGWGTGLKPALELITLARSPLEYNNTSQNVHHHRTGALNIEKCRVEIAEGDEVPEFDPDTEKRTGEYINKGRWPANVAHDGSPEVLEALGEKYRFFFCGKASPGEREAGLEGLSVSAADIEREAGKALSGPKKNIHPTVKPIALMRWLVRMVTPPGGTVLDPFCGSGSTGCAAAREDMEFIGIELDPEYIQIAQARIDHAETERQYEKSQMQMF